jgi:hypothetical protein
MPQLATALYSRTAAMVMKQRLDILWPFLANSGEMTVTATPPKYTLTDLCTQTSVRYIMTQEKLSASPLATIPASAPLSFRGMKLYQCTRAR